MWLIVIPFTLVACSTVCVWRGMLCSRQAWCTPSRCPVQVRRAQQNTAAAASQWAGSTHWQPLRQD